MPRFLRYLTRSGRLAEDVHKRPPTKVPEPVGPLLFFGAAVGELVAAFVFHSVVPLAVLGAAAVAFLVGLTDDLFVLGGRMKPLLLVLAAVPLIGLIASHPDLYQSLLNFPILGATSSHFTIYAALVIIAFPVVANAFNMMDAFNGEISWFTLLTSLALLFGVVLRDAYTAGFSPARIGATLPLVAVSAGFVVYNRFPSRAFDGDSGALMFGAMFAALAVTDGVEIAAVVAMVPAILNSFYIISSVRGLVERRRMHGRPTYLGEDGKLYASPETDAPATLARMVLLDGPLTENDLVKSILYLTAFSCILSALTSILTWVV